MTNRNKGRLRADIAEAFGFARFLLKNPRMLNKVRNGSTVRIVPAGTRPVARLPRGVEAFTTETVFHRISS